MIGFDSCLVNVSKCSSLEKYIFSDFTVPYRRWILSLTLKSLLSRIQFHFISWHWQHYVCTWSQYWLRDVQTTTVACRASFLISCLHDQPRSTAINHDQHGRSGGVTLYDQQESQPACGPRARLASNEGDVDSIAVLIFVDISVELTKTVSEAKIQITPLIVDQPRGWHRTREDEDSGISRETVCPSVWLAAKELNW